MSCAKLLKDYPQLSVILEELDDRFIIGLDPKVLGDSKLIFFKIQKAYWYYKDHFESDFRAHRAPYLSLETFGQLLIEASSVLSHIYPHALRESKFREWQDYLRKIPRLGAICINPGLDKVLMIQPYGRNRKCLQFPRGKLHAGEDHSKAAAREVWEECGIRIENLIDDQLFLEATIETTLHKLYLVYPVMEEALVPSIQCNKEIEQILWLPISHLPSLTEEHKNFYGVAPFVGPIRKFVSQMKREGSSGPVGTAPATGAVAAGASISSSVKILKRPPQNIPTASKKAGWSFEDMIAANERLKANSEKNAGELVSFRESLLAAFVQGWNTPLPKKQIQLNF